MIPPSGWIRVLWWRWWWWWWWWGWGRWWWRRRPITPPNFFSEVTPSIPREGAISWDVFFWIWHDHYFINSSCVTYVFMAPVMNRMNHQMAAKATENFERWVNHWLSGDYFVERHGETLQQKHGVNSTVSTIFVNVKLRQSDVSDMIIDEFQLGSPGFSRLLTSWTVGLMYTLAFSWHWLTPSRNPIQTIKVLIIIMTDVFIITLHILLYYLYIYIYK